MSVAIIGFNSPRWFISYLGAIMAGGIGASMYTTNSADTCKYIAEKCRAVVMVVENQLQRDKILKIAPELSKLRAIIQYTDVVSDDIRNGQDLPVYSWKDFKKLGSDLPEYELQWRLEAQKPGQCTALIYTSGTTGHPKGVMLSHDNLTWTASAIKQFAKIEEDYKVVSYLPLSHIAAQLTDIFLPIVCRGSVWFARPDALKGSLIETLKDVKPTYFMAVPRVWEKLADEVRLTLSQATGLKKKFSSWAMSVGLDGGYRIQDGGDTPFGWWIANRFLFRKTREKLGLDKCKLQGCAAAPIARETLDFFLKLGIPVYEVYGMSESTGPQTVSYPGHHHTGTAGESLKGSELKILHPDEFGNGEICYRGRHIFMGYIHNEEKTREALDSDGWLHSGDLGKIDDKGYLIITGRLKEMLITAGGENIAPVPLEQQIKNELPMVSHCLVVGDKRKFLTMIVTLKCEFDSEGVPTNKLSEVALGECAKIGSNAKTVTDACVCLRIRQYIRNGMQKVNATAESHAQKIQKFDIVPEDFSIVGGELTHNLKVRRPEVLRKYADVIQLLYDS
ncbi:long-chain-fatty-acid--CoA ligase ACSBG2-like [Corticium candelabrum]|uniref:long-chain-fatty-acid--CoA ligase ACSBG2-like n=1 Tax=Corticium candelabrum TaxID=121492 RepID=UPI002E253CEA|nr:long-chain-fatty-acid--CoA ligase ACSBG2-like [Corticium candelabrum]